MTRKISPLLPQLRSMYGNHAVQVTSKEKIQRTCGHGGITVYELKVLKSDTVPVGGTCVYIQTWKSLAYADEGLHEKIRAGDIDPDDVPSHAVGAHLFAQVVQHPSSKRVTEVDWGLVYVSEISAWPESPRGKPLIVSRAPTPGDKLLTVEYWCKWYELFLVSYTATGFEVTIVPFPEGYVDHYPNPTTVQELAEKNGWELDELAEELIVGRWMIYARNYWENLEARTQRQGQDAALHCAEHPQAPKYLKDAWRCEICHRILEPKS